LYNFTTMFDIRLAKDYLMYRLKAKTRHGLHSPFVYRLVDKVIYDFDAKKVYPEVEKNRKRLNAAERNAAISPKIAQLIYRLVADWHPGNIVEMGTGVDNTTIYLQKAAPYTKVYGVKNKSEFLSVAENLGQLDCVLIKGGQSILEYFELCIPKVHDGTLLIVDGIYRTQEMKETWTQIKAHPQVTITVDLFWIGLVYFRKGQVKEDFLIRV
jgi:predicted O-methyltransferase YrrM